MEKLECIGVLSEATLWVKDKAPFCSQIPFRQIPVKSCWNVVWGQIISWEVKYYPCYIYIYNECEYNSTCKKVAASFLAQKNFISQKWLSKPTFIWEHKGTFMDTSKTG